VIPPRLLFDPTESDLDRQVRELALRYGWPLAYHTFDSRRSTAGFPDWIFARHSRLVALELKTTTGRPTLEQVQWIGVLQTIPGVDAAIIQPSGLQHAADLLAGKRR
jgi:hypothetical protein